MRTFFLSTLLLLAACEQLGIEDPAKVAAAKEAEGRAIGGACRHAGRALEDCYTLNPKVSKAAIYAGWREMDTYMRENNLEVIPPQIARPEAGVKKKKGGNDAGNVGSEPAANQSEAPAPAKST